MNIREAKLPEKLSACIRLALSDLNKVERSKKNYRVNMTPTWHEYIKSRVMKDGTPITKGYCNVCFAGSVMAKTFKVDKRYSFTPHYFQQHNANRLLALDAIRGGSIAGALWYLGKRTPFGVADEVDITPYKTSPIKFKKEVAKIAELLEFVGE